MGIWVCTSRYPARVGECEFELYMGVLYESWGLRLYRVYVQLMERIGSAWESGPDYMLFPFVFVICICYLLFVFVPGSCATSKCW
jgi:hypothetical protein